MRWKKKSVYSGIKGALDAKPKRAKPRKLEDPIHIACLQWLNLVFIGMVYHCPNGLFGGSEVIFLHGKPVRRASVMWAKLVKLGARAGVLDLTLHWLGPDGVGRTAYLEIKSEDGRYTEGQKEFMEDLDRFGIPHRLCRSLEDCQRAAVELGLPLKNFHLSRLRADMILS